MFEYLTKGITENHTAYRDIQSIFDWRLWWTSHPWFDVTKIGKEKNFYLTFFFLIFLPLTGTDHCRDFTRKKSCFKCLSFVLMLDKTCYEIRRGTLFCQFSSYKLSEGGVCSVQLHTALLMHRGLNKHCVMMKDDREQEKTFIYVQMYKSITCIYMYKIKGIWNDHASWRKHGKNNV